MGYAFMTIEKIKSYGQLTAKYNHNCRVKEVDNAIPELAHLNEDLVTLPEKNGKQLNYKEAFKERINSLDYYKEHNIRRNAVLAYELVLTYSRDADVDVETWKQKNVEWLNKTFNVAGDDKNNILHVIFHGDETGNVHCHAIVVPIDERGRLNAKRFTDGSRVMRQLQTDYAKDMEELGLERGLAGSSAKHKKIRNMYASMNNAKRNIPEPLENETAVEFKKRCIEELEALAIVSKRKTNDYQVKRRRDTDEKIAKELELLKKETDKLNEREKQYESKITTYDKMIENLEKQYSDVLQQLTYIEGAKDKIEFAEKFQEGLKAINENEPEAFPVLQNDIDYIMRAAEEYEERKELYEDNFLNEDF